MAEICIQTSNEQSIEPRYISTRNNMTLNSSIGNPLKDFGIPEEFQFILLLLYAITCMVVLLGNSVICYTTYRVRSFRTVTNFFIVCLAVTDVVMTVMCVPFSILSNLFFHYWPFWSFLCPIVGFVQMASVLCRSFMLVAITCDMYHAATKPLNPRLTTSRAKLMVALICALSCLIALPSSIYSTIEYLPYEPGSKGLCIEKWPDDYVRGIYGICIMMLQYFIPLIIMVFTYIHIGIIIWIKRTPGEAHSRRDQRLASSKRKTIKMIIVVVIAYLLSWLPLHVITIVGDLDQSIFNSPYVHMTWLISHWLAFSNSGVNPVIYYWMNSKFRHNVLSCLRVACFCKGKRRKRTVNMDASYVKSGRHETGVTVTSYHCSTPSPCEIKDRRFFCDSGLRDDCVKCDRV
ncbi:RYamide receptor-like [Ylistrum balloti]|uniref:RYamide receptor-like n=1 Tax=Ylistrum balloti TaxID=509963 RepID=UPI002905BD39|nr:RYamide receptor-like [Ylistrum balloti]